MQKTYRGVWKLELGRVASGLGIWLPSEFGEGSAVNTTGRTALGAPCKRKKGDSYSRIVLYRLHLLFFVRKHAPK